MFRFESRAWLGLLALASTWGCGSQGEGSTPPPFGSTGGSAGAAGSTATVVEPQSLAFSSSPLRLLPEATGTLDLRATPPGRYDVRLSFDGDSGNASLDRADVETDDEGRASVRVTAPDVAAAFFVVASTGTVSSSALVSVSDRGYASLRVTPRYDGQRSISEWVATAHLGASCSVLAGTPPPDGAFTANAPAAGEPVLADLPVGPPLAVTLRAGQYVGGCADVPGLTSTREAATAVIVSNRPLQLTGNRLELSLGLDRSRDIDRWLALEVEELSKRWRAGAQRSDSARLLDSMQLAAGSASPAFAEARSRGDWDTYVGTAFGALEPEFLLGTLRSWTERGQDRLLGVDTLRGNLVTGAESGAPEVVVDSVGGVTSTRVPFTLVPNSASYAGDARDTLSLGASFEFSPAALSRELALVVATSEQPTSTSLAGALADRYCPALATLLSGGYQGCDGVCVAQLCSEALEGLVARGVGDERLLAKVTLSASGAAGVDDQARPDRFEGSWVGALAEDGQNIPIGGSARGGPPPVP